MSDNKYNTDPHGENVNPVHKDAEEGPDAGWQEPTAYDNTGSEAYQQPQQANTEYQGYQSYQQQPQQGYQSYQQPQQGGYQTYMQNGDVRLQPVGVGEWIGTMFLMMIPIANIILLFVWAFGNSAKLSKRNWARASLIMALIGIGVAILLAGILVPVFLSLFREISYGFY